MAMTDLQGLLKSVQTRTSAWQTQMEAAWPFPERGSMFNLCIRDLIASIFICVAAYALVHWTPLDAWQKALVAGLLVSAEPAMLVLPYNVFHAVVHRSPRFWDPLIVEPKLQHLLNSFGDLQREAAAILKNPPSGLVDFAAANPFQRRIAEHQPWKVLPFFSYGTVHQENCALAPITASLLKQIPSIRLAMYSVMLGGAEIPMHCGFFKSSLRVHITLFVDEEDPDGTQRFIEVGGTRYSWKTGDMVAFDDTYPHRVVNRVRGRRLVLFLDVDRPYDSAISKTVADVMTALMQQSPNVKSIAAAQERLVAL